MIINKILLQKIIIALGILLAFVGIASYFILLKKSPPIAVQPTASPTVSSTPKPTITPIPTATVTPTPTPVLTTASTDFFTYGKNDQIFSISKSEFKILNNFSALKLANKSKDCGINKSEQYFKQLLSHYSINDNGTEYHLTYKGQTQDTGVWIVTVIPNKLGYTNLNDFKNDFDLCEAGSNKYPALMSEKYLLFVSSCGTGFDDGSGFPHGCDVIREIVEPTIKLK